MFKKKILILKYRNFNKTRFLRSKVLISLIVVGLLMGGYFFYQEILKAKITIPYTKDLSSRVFFAPERGYAEVNRNKKILVWDPVKGEEVIKPGDLSWPLIDLIRRSEKSIDIASYIFSSNTWEYRELLAANQRGVKIRLFLDTSIKDDEGNPIINPLIEELKTIKPVIEVKVLDPEKIEQEIGITFRTMHEKFGILDGKYLFNGSANVENKANTLYTEDRFFFKDNPSLINAFRGEFDLLWRNGKWLIGSQ